MSVKPIPDDHHSVTPYLIVAGASELLEFLARAFGAELMHRTETPDGVIAHAEVRIGDSPVMIGEARDPWQPMPAVNYLYVEDTDKVYQQALDAGARSLMAPADMFYGDRNAGVQDPCGNMWWIATHIEDVPPDELDRRANAAFSEPQD